MIVGIPKEKTAGEARVAATPDTVEKMKSIGLDVVIEREAGLKSHFTDADYDSAGAEVSNRKKALSADIVLVVQKPDGRDIKQIKSGAVLVGFMDMCNDDGTLGKLAEKGVTAFALEMIPRISRAQPLDALSSQSGIGGYRAAVTAANLYDRFFPMMMTAAGSTRPAKVIVIGAGVAGLQAAATARRLGAEVAAFDVRPEVKEQVMSLGAKFIELDVGESGEGEGGYAKELSEKAKEKLQELLTEELKKADIVISTAQIPCRPAPRLISEEAIKAMRHGSVVIDMAASSGGNCPLTEPDKIIERYGVKIAGYTNYPAMMAGDASAFYARNLLGFVKLLTEEKDGAPVFKNFMEDEITSASLVTHKGKLRSR